MATQLTAEDARQSLTAHVEAKGVEVFVKYGPQIGWGELQRLLADRVFVRYPVEIVFDAAELQLGEFAHPVQKSDGPEEGFTMYVHPLFSLELERVASAVLYQLVAVNYGEFASSDEAETFGAAALGLTRDEYYNLLCEMSAQVGGDADQLEPGLESDMTSEPAAHLHAGGCGGGCGHGGCDHG